MIGGKDMARRKMNTRRLAKDVGLDRGDNEPILERVVQLSNN